MINRRQILAGVAAMGSVASRQVMAQEQWFLVTGDNGKPVANMRLPVELTSEIDLLEGIVWIGSTSTDVVVAEFFDYNCPYCRTAVRDIYEFMQADADLRVGLVNNSILSPMLRRSKLR
jgi:protein-disulfide isomerase